MHFNPAVSLAVLVSEGKEHLQPNALRLAAFTVTQILGAVFGCSLVYICSENVGNNIVPAVELMCPQFAEKYQPKGVKCSTTGLDG